MPPETGRHLRWPVMRGDGSGETPVASGAVGAATRIASTRFGWPEKLMPEN